MADNESPFVVFYEMVNAGGTATLHVTHRADPGETYDAFIARVKASILTADPQADLTFVFKDAPKGHGKGSGFGGGKKAAEITGGEFVITHVERIERPNKKEPGKFWWDFAAYGQQNGQEVTAQCFVGSPTWSKPDNPVVACGLFPNFGAWIAGERKAVPATQVWTAHVVFNDSYKRYEIVKITSS